MSPRTRKILLQVGSFGIAALLLYLALRGVDFRTVGADLAAGHYIWVIPLIGVVLFSLFIRAWRWRLLLHALGERDDGDGDVSLKLTFYSLMIGYMANYAAPRLGEVVRSGNLAARQNLHIGGVLGTVVIERILDMLTLLLALLTLPFVFGSRIRILKPLLLDPMVAWADSLGSTTGLLLVFGVLVLIAVGTVLWRRHRTGRHESRIRHAIQQFRDGMRSLHRTGRPVAVIVSTIAMWVSYLFMAYMPLLIFGMTSTYDLNLLDAWGLMLLGSIGIVIPSPGGIGSYHYITIQSMVLLFGIPQTAAASYAIFSHAGQLVIYVALGFLSMILEGASWSELSTSTTRKDSDRSP